MKTIKTRQDDTMIEVSIKTTPAVIDFNDILAACEIVPDYDYNPFDCDGLEHTNHERNYYSGAFRPGLNEDALADEMRGAWSDYHGQSGVITVDRAHAIREQWGAGISGLSKQVKAEMIAQNIGETIDYIKTWYDGSGEAYGVTVDYEGYHDSCYGYDSYDYAKSQQEEHARVIAYQMERDGYTIENKPQRTNGQTREEKRARIRYNLTTDCWKTYKYHTTTRAKRLPRRARLAA